MSRIAFIGLGNMGGPMAANLVKKGYNVCGFDIASANLASAEKQGVKAAGSAAECVEGADVVVTMLPTGPHVIETITSYLPSLGSGALVIDCSTIDPGSAREAHRLTAESGARCLDAPVSGGIGGAASGTLTFMVGGDAAAFLTGKPILEAMGRRIVHCGEAGSGQGAKICNNMITGITMIAVSEAFVLAERLGLSAEALYEVASTSSGQCWALTSYCPKPGILPDVPSSKGYKAGFAAPLMLKDLRLAQQAALASAASTPLGAHAAQLYTMFVDEVPADRDFSGIIEFLKNMDSPREGDGHVLQLGEAINHRPKGELTA